MTNAVTSADGTTLAYDVHGDGPPIVVVGGATNTKEAWTELCEELAKAGFAGVTYDRRGRGGSGDTRPYAVDREIEDLVAVIGAVTDGPAGVHAISSGGALAYRATAAGAPVRTLSVLEAPYRVAGAPTPPADYLEHLAELYAQDDGDAMFAYFLTAGVGQPPEVVEEMRTQPNWSAMAAVGPTTYYDALCLGTSQAPLATDVLSQVLAPVLSVASTGSPDWLVDAAKAAADAVPDGTFMQLEGEFHNVPAPVLAPVLAGHHR